MEGKALFDSADSALGGDSRAHLIQLIGPLVPSKEEVLEVASDLNVRVMSHADYPRLLDNCESLGDFMASCSIPRLTLFDTVTTFGDEEKEQFFALLLQTLTAEELLNNPWMRSLIV